jgi:superfamily II DNA or RNA helicase
VEDFLAKSLELIIDRGTTMAKIILKNDISQITTTNETLAKFLYENLRFRDRNYFHNRAYRQRIWDGFTNFFNKNNGKFLTGLLPEILMACKAHKEEVQILDQRTKVDFAVNEINSTFLHSCTPAGSPVITLEDYQVDLVNSAIKNKRGVIFAPTSAGKSLTMLSILKCLPAGTKTLVLQNRKTLAIQNYEEYTKWGLHNVGRIWGGVDEPNDITVSTVQSISKAADLLPEVEVLLVDEIHDMMSTAPKAVYRMLKKCSVRIAVSATPFKFGDSDKIQKFYVKGFFGPPFKIKSTETGIVTTQELQNRGRLSKSRCIFHKINSPDLEYELYQDAVNLGIVENNTLHEKVVELATAQSGRTLILVDRLAHGDTLQSLIPNALWVQGKDNDETRKQVIEQLQKSENCIAIATQGIFNTGINVFVHTLINAAGGQADHQIIQRMGRGLRTAKDKEELLYIDFIFETNPYLHKHSMKRVKILQKQGHSIEILD